MFFWSWIQCPNVLLVVEVSVVINAVVWDMVMKMKMSKECTFLILNAMDMVCFVLFWLTVYLAKHSKEKVLVYIYIYGFIVKSENTDMNKDEWCFVCGGEKVKT